MGRTITLLASGTRGDIDPYLVLGLGLRAAGYNVRIATHDRFIPRVEQYGLPFARLAENPSDLLVRAQGHDALRLRGNPLRTLRATLAYWRAARPVMQQLLVSAWHAAQGTDALVIGLPTLWGIHIAQALGVPCVRALLQPLTPTAEFPSPLIPFRHSLGRRANRLSYLLVDRAISLAWQDLIGRWRVETLQLCSKSPQPDTHHLPTVYGFSEHVVPRPADWPPQHIITGYWVLPPPREWRPSSSIEEFLARGDTPIYIGLGSMTESQPQRTFDLITRALETVRLRAVLLGAHGFQEGALPLSVLPVQDAPHAWLFPRMAAVVHHGGAGTTGAGLRAGVATLIVPQVVDQFFWGERVVHLGAGPRPLALDSLTAERLARALQDLTRAEFRGKAGSLAVRIGKEDGVARAVEVIQRQVA
ncbi:MAG: glycosyltransferase [Anaerolineae bacterium]